MALVDLPIFKASTLIVYRVLNTGAMKVNAFKAEVLALCNIKIEAIEDSTSEVLATYEAASVQPGNYSVPSAKVIKYVGRVSDKTGEDILVPEETMSIAVSVTEL